MKEGEGVFAVEGGNLQLEVHVSIFLPPLPTCFFRSTNKTICMAEKKGSGGK